MQHLPQLAHHRRRAVAVGLVHDEHVGDFQDAGLRHLHRVAEPGSEHHHGRIGRGRDVDLCLPHADGLDDDQVEPRRLQDAHGLRRGERHAPQMPSGRHRPDEHIRVGGMLLHPDPVSEQRAAGVGRGRVDRENGDPAAGGARRAHERGRQGGFPDPRRAGQSQGRRGPRVSVDARGQGGQLGPPILNQRDRARDGARLAVQHAPGQHLDVHAGPSLSSGGIARRGGRLRTRHRRKSIPQRSAVLALLDQRRVVGRRDARRDHGEVDLLPLEPREQLGRRRAGPTSHGRDRRTPARRRPERFELRCGEPLTVDLSRRGHHRASGARAGAPAAERARRTAAAGAP